MLSLPSIIDSTGTDGDVECKTSYIYLDLFPKGSIMKLLFFVLLST